ncbi:SigE family RNA polymerase sigma factor [Nonomuraea polychroma]|uniref:SigE family RNA polymerase sigma factor n=1 Tax=Nonomuraea polychroma TaxID=46176 RepID=UPI003D920573
MSDPTEDAAYAAFVEAAWNRHMAVAILLTGDRHRGEELLQDCLVRLYVRWRRVGSTDPHAYLRRMLVNGNVSWWRRRQREMTTADPPDHADPRSAPYEPNEDLRRALLSLPRRQRAIVVLRHYEDLTEKAVAAALGCTVGTVKNQHFRAMARLRTALRENQEAAR